MTSPNDPDARNVLGGPLKTCNLDPLTGFFRDGCCHTGPQDHGLHTVCVELTEAFLQYSFTRGNDLITPRPEWNFTGLKPDQRWCLCAARWEEARRMGLAPPVDLEATHIRTLSVVRLEDLQAHAAPSSPVLSAHPN